MGSRSHRVFVGNLPHDVTRDEIVSKFKKYGTVESVEIKTKKDETSGQVLATFCYVNLDIDSESLRSCVLLLNGIKWGERHIKVEPAKESFLQRLQRERQAAINTQTTQQPSKPQPQKTIETFPKESMREKKVVEKKRLFKQESSSSDSSDSEDEGTSHPTSKLPMFRGISSIVESSQSKPTFQNKFKPKEAVKVDFKSAVADNDSNISKKSSKPEKSSDILKKFESFSDVWKDADNDPYPMESFNSKQNSRMNKRHSDQAFSIERNSSSGNNEWQSQKQPFQKDEKRSAIGELDASRTNIAEEKRLKSIEAKRQAFEQQKKAVQLALSDKSAPRSNKKIVFDDNAYDDQPVMQKKRSKLEPSKAEVVSKPKEKEGKALTLFDDSDEEGTADKWSSEFQVKKQFEGAKGKKLLDLQNKYNNDQRFKLDERFYDSDGDETKNTNFGGTETKSSEEGIEGLAEEREQQLQILSSIIGKPISASLPPAPHESKTKGMLRFDPLKPNHSKFELAKEPQESKKKRKSKTAELEREGEEEGEENDEETDNSKVRREEKEPEPVSQNKFYSVSDTLAESLRKAKEGQGSGFSLLQMFGSTNVPSEKKERHVEAVSRKEGLKKPVSLDDSSSDDDDETDGPTADVNSVTHQPAASSRSGVRTTGGVWQESFFFQPDDMRLKEGAEFFSKVDDTPDTPNFAKKREALRQIMKIKLKKNARKANSFKTKVGALRKKAYLWPKSNGNVQEPRPRRRQRN